MTYNSTVHNPLRFGTNPDGVPELLTSKKPALDYAQFRSMRYDADLGSDCDQYSQSSSDGSSTHDSQLTPQSPVSYSSDDSSSEPVFDSCKGRSTVTSPSQNCLDWSKTKLIPYGLPSPSRDVLTQSLEKPSVNVPIRLKSSVVAENTRHISPDSTNIVQPIITNHASEQSSSDAMQSRRRGRSVCGPAHPPVLRRDTDHTDAIVKMIVMFCTNLINSIWSSGSSNVINMTTAHPGSNVLPLQVFITETLRRSKTSYSTLQIALYYLILLKQCLPSGSQSAPGGCRAMQCGRRMFLAALILASKYLQDRNYSARAWSKISGLPLKEINENERRFLSIVCWDLHVPKSTFENWSKIVLNVCRRSMDSDPGCKSGLDRFPPGPDSGPNAQKQCFLSSMCKDIDALRSWWLVTLQKLRTDIVKCGVKTQSYVEAIAPYRDGIYLPRPVSEHVGELEYADTFLESDYKLNLDRSRQSSLERSSKRFEPVADLLHPAAPTALPPQPIMRNLPTPQTTPQTDLSGYWTPQPFAEPTKPGLRCHASASALGNAFRKHHPIANLATCPPPAPRACQQAQNTFNAVESTLAHVSLRSLTSSPESIISDASSFAPRSRSSSISSVSSWATVSSQSSGRLSKEQQERLLRDLASDQNNYQQQLAQQMPWPGQQTIPRRPTPPGIQNIERPRTAFMVGDPSKKNHTEYFLAKNDPVTGDRFVDEGYVSDEYAKRKQEAAKQEAAQVLAGLHIDTTIVDECAVRSRARPVLDRSRTQIHYRGVSQNVKPLHLKRSRADLMEPPRSKLSTICYSTNSANSTAEDVTEAVIEGCPRGSFTTKDIQHPSQGWAAPRKPLQFGLQGKRLALQMSADSPATELAGKFLKTQSYMHKLGPVVH